MQSAKSRPPLRFRTVWVSDVHLGFRGCNAEFVLDFLRSVHCDYLYLAGDIIDIWAMRRRPCWPQSQNDVVRTMLGEAKRGTKIIYVPGNHDELLREYDGMTFGNIHMANEIIHTKADGSRLLALHGDQFDGIVRCSKAVSIIGSQIYGLLPEASRIVTITAAASWAFPIGRWPPISSTVSRAPCSTFTTSRKRSLTRLSGRASIV